MKLIKFALVVLLLFAFADVAGALCTSVVKDGSTARVYNGGTLVGSRYIGSLQSVDYGGAYAIGQSASEVCVFSCTTNTWSCSTFSGIASLHKGSDYVGVLYNSNRVKVWTLSDNAWGTEQSFTGGVTGGSSGVYAKEGYVAVLYDSGTDMKIWNSITNTWSTAEPFTGGASGGTGGVYAGNGYIGVLYDGSTDMKVWTLASGAWGSATAFSGPANGVYAGEGYIGVMYDGSTDMKIWTLAANAWGGATTFSGPANSVHAGEGYIGVIYDSSTDAKVWTLAANAWGSTTSFTGGVSNTYAGRGYFGVLYDDKKRMKVWSSASNSWGTEKWFSVVADYVYAGEGYIGVLHDNGSDVVIWTKSSNSWGTNQSFGTADEITVYAKEGYIGVMYARSWEPDDWAMDVWSLASGTWDHHANAWGADAVYAGNGYIGVLHGSNGGNRTHMIVWELGEGWGSDHFIFGGANTVTMGLGHIGVLHTSGFGVENAAVDVWARGSGWDTHLLAGGTGDKLFSCGPLLTVQHDSATDLGAWVLGRGWDTTFFNLGIYNTFASGNYLYVLSDYESGSPPNFPRWDLDIGNMSINPASWTDMGHVDSGDTISHGTPSTTCSPPSCPSNTCVCAGGTYTTCEGDKIYSFDYCNGAQTLVTQCKPSTTCTNACSPGGKIECSADNTKQRVCGIYTAAGETCAETSETAAECQAQQPCLGWGVFEDCGAGKVCVSGSGCVAQLAACAVTSASPATIVAGGSSTINISYSNFSAKPTTGAFACGNGATAGTLTCTGTTTGTCTVACNSYTTEGSFSATAALNNGATPVSCTGSATVTVTAAPAVSVTAQTPINAGSSSVVTATYSGFSGGTPTAAASTLGCGGGGASVSVPLSCTASATPGNGTCTFTCEPYSPAGTYTISVTLSNGTGAGKQSAIGTKIITVNPTAGCNIVSANPSLVDLGGSSTITISYSSFGAAVPTTGTVECGDGAAEGTLTCTGRTICGATGCTTSGTCTFSCSNYNTEGAFSATAIVNNSATPVSCTGGATVTVTAAPAVSASAETPILLDKSSIVTATYANFTAGDAPTLAESTIGCGLAGATVSGFSCADNGDGTGTCTFTCGLYAAEGTYTVSITLRNGIESPSTTVDVDVGGPVCGNNAIDAGEVCDDTELGTEDCATQGFDGGTLGCAADCLTFDTSGCTECGDGTIDAGEECDGTELGGQTCAGLGYAGGTLACTASCTLDTGLCTGAGPECGNGTIETGEDCDGADFDGQTCLGLGLPDGTLVCTSSCTLDTSNCTVAPPPVGGEPELRIFSAAAEPITVMPAGSTSIIVVVKNLGAADSSGTVEISDPADVLEFDPSSDLTGNISSGSIVSGTFAVNVPGSAEIKNYPVEIALRDADGYIVDTATVYLNVRPATEAIAVPEVPPVFATLAALGVLLILWRRK